jgi:hypothetical protein
VGDREIFPPTVTGPEEFSLWFGVAQLVVCRLAVGQAPEFESQLATSGGPLLSGEQRGIRSRPLQLDIIIYIVCMKLK